MEFHEIFRTWRKKQLTRLFDAWLDCFMLLRLGAVEVCALEVILVTYDTILGGRLFSSPVTTMPGPLETLTLFLWHSVGFQGKPRVVENVAPEMYHIRAGKYGWFACKTQMWRYGLATCQTQCAQQYIIFHLLQYILFPHHHHDIITNIIITINISLTLT